MVATPGELTKAVAYTYDVFDRLIGKQVDDDGDGNFDRSESYVYDGDDVVAAFDDTGSLTNRYLHGDVVDQVFASEDALGEILWALTDNQGTVRDVVDYDEPTDATSIANHRQFDAFGNITAESDPTVEFRYAYTGRFFDWDTHLQYNRARWYDAAVALWLSEDPIGFAAGDANLGRYVGNGPSNSTDPDGLESRWDSFVRWIAGSAANGGDKFDKTLEVGNGIGRGALNSFSLGAFGKIQDKAAKCGAGTFRYNKTAAKWSERSVDALQLGGGFLKKGGKEVIEAGSKQFVKKQGSKQAAKKAAANLDDVQVGIQNAGKGLKPGAKSGGLKPVRIGKQGEKSAGLKGTKKRIASVLEPGRYRIPDELTEVTLREIKNAAKCSNTKQLRDYLRIAEDSGRTFILEVRKNTELSKPLQELIKEGRIIKKIIGK